MDSASDQTNVESTKQHIDFEQFSKMVEVAMNTYDSQLHHLQQRLAGYEMASDLLGHGNDNSQRLWLIKRCQELYDWSPNAGSAVHFYTGVALGNSLSVKVTNPQHPANGGGGAKGQINDAVQTLFDACFEARYNQDIFSGQSLIDLSDQILTDGEVGLAFFKDEAGGVRVRKISAAQIERFICNPDDNSEVWFYKRVWYTRDNGPAPTMKTRYYVKWDLDDQTESRAMAWLLSGDGPGATSDQIARTRMGNDLVYMTVVQFRRGRDNRGVPLLKRVIDYIDIYINFIQDRSIIVRNRATYLDEYEVAGGLKAVQQVRNTLNSTLQGGGVFGQNERNPAHAAGSALVHNKGVKTSQRSAATGAEDAQKDAAIFRSQVSSGVSIPIPVLFMDAEAAGSLNSVIELMRRSEPLWLAYRVTLHTFFGELVKFLARANGLSDDVTVDIDSPPIVREDLAVYTTAVMDGKNHGLIPQDEAARLYMARLGSNHIDDLIEQLKREKTAAHAAPNPATTPASPIPPGAQIPEGAATATGAPQEMGGVPLDESAVVAQTVAAVIKDLGYTHE